MTMGRVDLSVLLLAFALGLVAACSQQPPGLSETGAGRAWRPADSSPFPPEVWRPTLVADGSRAVGEWMDPESGIRLVQCRRVEELWSPPQFLPFEKLKQVRHPCLHPLGRFLVCSALGATDQDDADRDLYLLAPAAGGWAAPLSLGPRLNSDAAESHPTLDASGGLYFASNRSGGAGGWDLYAARMVRGAWGQAEALAAPIASPWQERDPWVSTDGRLLLFASDRPGGRGDLDLYLSWLGPWGWSQPLPLGPSWNSPGADRSPRLGPEGRWLWWMRDGRPQRRETAELPFSLDPALRPQQLPRNRPAFSDM